MVKATKITLAALFLAGSVGLAAAQTGGADSGGVATDKPANKDTIGTSKQQSQQIQPKTGPTNPANAGPDETGTAKDTAGSGTQRDPAKQKQ